MCMHAQTASVTAACRRMGLYLQQAEGGGVFFINRECFMAVFLCHYGEVVLPHMWEQEASSADKAKRESQRDEKQEWLMDE